MSVVFRSGSVNQHIGDFFRASNGVELARVAFINGEIHAPEFCDKLRASLVETLRATNGIARSLRWSFEEIVAEANV